MKFLDDTKIAVLRYLLILLPLALPLYLIRFRPLGLPTTALEVYLGILFVIFTLTYGGAAWRQGWTRAGVWRYALIGWGTATLIAAFISPSLWTGLGLWRAYVLEPILVFLTLFVLLEKEDVRRKFVQSLFAVCWIVAGWAIIQFLSGKGIPHPWNVAIAAGRRATGPYPFPNALALFVTPIAAFAFAEWIKKPRYFFALATSFVCLVAILLAKSDGGLIALSAAVALMLCTKRWGRWLVASGALAGALVLLLSPSLRLSIWNELTFNGWSGKVRLIMWRETWTMLKDHWFFGAGLGGYPKVFDAYHKARFIEIFQYPHTILFNFWTETGLPGVIAFLGIILTWIKRGWKTAEASLPGKRLSGIVLILAPLITILVHGLVDVPYFKNDLAIIFWILAFLMTSIPSVVRERVNLA